MARETIPFVKMEGLGNDFVVIDGRAGPEIAEAVGQMAPSLCDRNRGVGADGVLVLTAPRRAGAACGLTIFNADGGTAEMCGNGLRCVGLFAFQEGWDTSGRVSVESCAGELTIWVESETQPIRTDLGIPRTDPASLPVHAPGEELIREPWNVEDRRFEVTCVSMGNPHCVVFLDPGEELGTFPVEKYGSVLETHTRFPKRTNVEFVEVLGEGRFRQRTWERGVGETLGCGTGAAAVAVADRLGRGKSRNEVEGRRVRIELPGGVVDVEWAGRGAPVYLEGPARRVFDGTFRCGEVLCRG